MMPKALMMFSFSEKPKVIVATIRLTVAGPNCGRMIGNIRNFSTTLPSGRISANGALTIAVIFVLVGSAVLYFSLPLMALILTWVTLFFYNVVYTPLKKVTAFAVIPGSMVGALPPMIGWAGAGGSLNSESRR